MAAKNQSEFSLDNVPSQLAGHIAKGERTASRSIPCPRNHYLVVLALRFILTYTDIYHVDGPGGMDQGEHDTWQVIWSIDSSGSTSIYLYKPSVKLTVRTGSGKELAVEVQEESMDRLAILEGSEELTVVRMNTGRPYNMYIPLPAAQGISRLLENAAHASQGTPSNPITCTSDLGRLTFVVTRIEDYCNDERELVVALDIDEQARVSGVNLRVNYFHSPDYYNDEEYDRGYGY